MSLLYVGIGGAIGAILRYLLSQLSLQHSLPIKTLFINLLGSLVIGFLSAKFQQSHWFEGDQLLITGVWVALHLLHFQLRVSSINSKWRYSTRPLYMAISLVGGLACVAFGYFLGQASF